MGSFSNASFFWTSLVSTDVLIQLMNSFYGHLAL